jgi:hypothetical protein
VISIGFIGISVELDVTSVGFDGIQWDMKRNINVKTWSTHGQ